jgi:hypothetical protein
MLELDECASKGIVCEKSSKNRQIRKKTVAVYMLIGVGDSGFPYPSAVTGKDSQITFQSIRNRKEADCGSDTKAQGIVEKRVCPGLALS